MSILNVNTIQPIGSGTTVTVAATELKTSNFITVGTGASVTSPSANVLTLGTNNAERFRIDSAGLVGIGTVSPSGPIHAHAASGTQRSYLEASAAHSFLRLKSGSTSYNSGLEFFSGASNIANINGLGAGGLQFETNSSEALRIDSSGRTLIGLNSSLLSYAGLQIKGDADSGAHICLANKTAAPTAGHNIGSLRFTNNAGGIGAIIGVEGDGTWSGSSYPSRIIFATTASGATSGTERLRIDSSGRTLIGSPNGSTSQFLQIKGDTGASNNGGTILLQNGVADSSAGNGTGLGGIAFGGATGNQYCRIEGFADGSGGTNDYPGRLSFSTTADGASSPSERMRITQAGEVQISNGNLKFSTSGTGIDFSAAGNASGMSSELLDDYEEGVFTATCANSVTLHSTVDLCQYVKIGSLVTVMGQIRVNNSNSNSDLTINNLPFTVFSAGEGSAYAVGAVRLYNADMSSLDQYVICLADGGTTNLQFQGVRDNGASVPLSATGDGYYMFSLTYRTST